MTPAESRETARSVLKTVPLVMRVVAAELRAAGELPAPAHFSLLTQLKDQPRTLTELASLQGVSLPTMSNSITAMVQRGWVTRTSPVRDRRVVIIDVTPNGRATLARVGRCAETHLAAILLPLGHQSGRSVRKGLGVLRETFARAQDAAALRPRGRSRRA